MFVYVIVCNETLKIYIGQHKGSDLGKYLSKKWFDAHRYSDKRSHLYAAMRKHPRNSWSIYPLISGVSTRIELDELERHFIRVLNVQNSEVGYNIQRGGEGFTGPQSESAKRKISRRMKVVMRGNDHGRGNAGKKYPKSLEWRQQVSEKMKGQPKTKAHAQSIGDGHRGLVYNLGNSWNVGRKASPETRAKMSAAQKRRQQT